MFRMSLSGIALFLLLFTCDLATASSHFAIMGDAGQISFELDRLKSSIKKEKVQSIIMPGDNLYSGTYERTWNSWKTQGFQFDVVAIGNHNDGYKEEVKYFSMPGEYYSKVIAGARFIVLNSDNKNNVQEQFSWLENEIKNASEELIFIIYHHPTFTITKKHHWQEREAFQLQMRQVLKTYGTKISALFLGHDHISSFLNFGEVPAIIAGAGREVRDAKPVSYYEDGFEIETRYLAPKTQHWAKLEILDGAQEARVHLIRVSDQRRVCSAQLKRASMALDSNCSR